MKSLGGGLREFRKGATGHYDEVEQQERRLPEKEKSCSEPAPEAQDGVLADQKES
jgi:hypothetical protein